MEILQYDKMPFIEDPLILLDDEDSMTWPEVLKYMFECANSADAGLRSCALHIFG